MPAKLRIGVIGATHDHLWGNLKNLVASPDAEFVAAYDANQRLLDNMKNKYGCPQTFLSADEMLKKVEMDAAWVFSDNHTSVELVEKIPMPVLL